jgi:hypothetical protein
LTGCNIRHGSGPFFTAGAGSYNVYDFKFDNNMVEAWTTAAGAGFLQTGLLVGSAIRDNLMEGNTTGTMILADGARGAVISGNYFESNNLDVDLTFNVAPAFSPQGVSFTGNSSTSTNCCLWGATGSGTTLNGCNAGGNYFGGSGDLHLLPLNAHLPGRDYAATGALYNNPPVSDRQNTAWTPTDGSGGGNALSGVGWYRMPGDTGMVEFEFEVTYPASPAGGSDLASITGLPIASASPAGLNDVIVGGTSYTNYTSYVQLLGAGGQTTVGLYVLGAQLTNTNLANKTLRCFGRYQAAV